MASSQVLLGLLCFTALVHLSTQRMCYDCTLQQANTRSTTGRQCTTPLNKELLVDCGTDLCAWYDMTQNSVRTVVRSCSKNINCDTIGSIPGVEVTECKSCDKDECNGPNSAGLASLSTGLLLTTAFWTLYKMF